MSAFLFKQLISPGRSLLSSKELHGFDIKLLKLMSKLLEKDAFDETILEHFGEIAQDFHNLISKNRFLESQVNIDSKTGLLKYSEDYIPMIMKSASRIADSLSGGYYNLSYVRFDIDDFSYINNRFGHDIGDIVLLDLANVLKDNSRPTDYAMRYGGEEFDVILPGTDIHGALAYMKKIFLNIEKLDYSFGDDHFNVTTSAGISNYTIPFDELKVIDPYNMKDDYANIQKCADDALYDAKVSGKNQFRVFDDTLNYSSIRKIYSEQKYIQSVN